ncbi:hypothetical protein RR46_10094 [Papilio xuthus]|uniref:Uncharacterized protein n=1 Tax=Papilio xuthus TaxID=66420 RepID=A0A194PZM7_PAPXU|nr:hypothetical protein RR46_10094 [Papilio xuthus]
MKRLTFIGRLVTRNYKSDFIHPCSELNDECFTQATLDAIPGVVRGIPEAGIPPLDPLYLDKNITMALPGNVKMTFHNGKLLGLSTCVPSKVSSRREQRTFVFDIQCNFTIKGHYSIVGRILLFNLNTDGNAKIKICANILGVLNSNSQLVAQEFGGPILDYAIDYAMNVTQKFFDAYTYDQISHVPLTDDFFEED